MDYSRNQYSEIIILHCFGVVMIFVCHILMRLGYMAIAEGFAAGVPLFLFVSGFLTGVSAKPFNLNWLQRKAKRVLLPYYLLLLIVVALFLILHTEPFHFVQWLPLFFNLQGLTNFVFLNDISGYYSPLAQGLGHFWYVTLIMLCYLCAVIVNVVYENCRFLRAHWRSILLLSFFVLQPLLVYYNVQLNCINVFFFGYFIAKSKVEITPSLFWRFTIIMVVFVCARLICRCFLDESVLYNQYVSRIATDSIGVWIVALVFFLRSQAPKFIDSIAGMKGVLMLDSIIYEVYLVHHIIVKGKWSVFNYVDSSFVAVVISVVGTILISVLLKKLSQVLTAYFPNR